MICHGSMSEVPKFYDDGIHTVDLYSVACYNLYCIIYYTGLEHLNAFGTDPELCAQLIDIKNARPDIDITSDCSHYLKITNKNREQENDMPWYCKEVSILSENML